MVRVAVGILKKGDKLLVADRPPDKPYSGYWEFPGGKIELNETGEEALKRELDEELGIQVCAATFMLEHKHTYPEKTVSIEVWQVTDYIGEPAPREGQQLRWVNVDEMLTLRLLDANVEIISNSALIERLS
ncbi:MAG TPA: NUDIX domain-containing protein [Gammaproteobacteria bacterium]|jgi:8-oxo-dGTP diphosphatase|nr:NUDIX domain-containing protein [Gammaproteobacteria bacterium]